jgi:hypothetical protein
MEMDREPLWAVRAGELESATWNVSPVKLPEDVGVPVMEPEAERARPAGSVPPMSDHL